MGFAPAVRLASDSQIKAKARAIEPMKLARVAASTLVALAAAPEAWGSLRSALVEYRSQVSGEATAEGAIDRLIGRASNGGERGPTETADEFRDSIGEIDDWISGTEAVLAGPESAGLVAELAASDAGSLVVGVGLFTREAVGVKTESTSGRDDADIARAKDQVKTAGNLLKFGVPAVLAVAVVGVGFYVWWTLS